MELSVDIGGTFTDFVYSDESGKISSFKLPSTPGDPSLVIRSGLKQLPGKPGVFIHGTTVATNTVLTRTGSRIAFVTTAGFKDILHIGRQVRPSLYDLTITRKPQLVPASLCFELDERVDSNGNIITPLQMKDLEVLTKKLQRKKVEAVAICFLFSYLNPKHERDAGMYLRSRLGIPVALSSELVPEFREFERASTTVMNAYLLNRVGEYLDNLRKSISRSGLSDYFVMQSSGGVALSRYVRDKPARTLLSGPAAGVSASAKLGELMGEPDLITFDMGGTSADVASIMAGNIIWTSEGEVDSLPLKLPMVEIVTIGAGGGSIASKDPGGALLVGPESAGAEPGPVCYGKGGKKITVTDANLMLGIIDPRFFLGGRFPLHIDQAKKIARSFAGSLDFTIDELAEGVRSVVEANMQRAIAKVTIEKGLDPRRFALVAFGGAGPIHATALAQELKIPRVIVPVSPGTFSAYGLLLSDITLDHSRTYLADIGDTRVKTKIDTILNHQKASARKALWAQKVPEAGADFRASLDLRYKGQSYEVNVPLLDDLERTVRAFHRLHESRFGYQMPDAKVELVNVRSSVTARRKTQLKKRRNTGRVKKSRARPEPLDIKTVMLDGNKYETAVFERTKLKPGLRLKGPVIVSDSGSTSLIPPGMDAEIDEYGNLVITI